MLRSDFFYYDTQTGFADRSLCGILKRRPNQTYEFNERFLDNYVGGRPCWPKTVVNGVEKRESIQHPIAECAASLECLIKNYLRSQIRELDVVLALSGGLDSQVLAVMLKELGYRVHALTLRTNLPGYCEFDEAARFAEVHRLDLIEVNVKPEQFVVALSDFVRLTESPIYNLHPISKLFLARFAKPYMSKNGITSLVTGDGADQIFQARSECDLYPLTVRIFREVEVPLLTPFAISETRSWVSRTGPWKTKEPIVSLAQMRGLQAQSKRSTYFPACTGFESKFDCLGVSLSYLEKELEMMGLSKCAESVE